MPSVQNITNIPAPRVEFIDPRTGLMSREWYRFFLNLFTLTGSGSNPTSLEDLQVGPAFQITRDMFVVDNPSPDAESAIASLTAALADVNQNLQTRPLADSNIISTSAVADNISPNAESAIASLAMAVMDLNQTLQSLPQNDYVVFNSALGTPSSGVVTNLTGTASININGTVGATTANTGAFTSLAYTTTLTGGTGIVNLGSGQFYKDASGNVMIGTTSSPTVSRLYINSAESRIQSRNSTSGANGYSGSLVTNEYRGAWAITNTIVTFGSNDIERFRLDTGGNLLVTSIGGLGYGTGSGGAQTQLTSRTTGVTLSKTNGAITMFSAAGSATAATFTVTNTTVAATDVVHVSVKSSTNVYLVFVTATAAGSFNITFQTTGGTAVDAPVINFAVIKAVTA
jgi:hypothetical protein